VEIQETLLAAGERANVDCFRSVDTHAEQGWPVRHGRDDEPAAVLEADETAVEQVVDAGCQKQAVFTVEALLVAGIPPGLAVTGDQVNGIPRQ